MDLPEDAEAVLIIELDGPVAGMDVLKQRVIEVCKEYNVRSIETASSDEERALLWKARKLAFGAIGRLSPDYYTQDGVVPRTKLPDQPDLRDYGIGAQILLDLDLHSIRLLTNNPKKVVGLDGYDIEITGRESLQVEPGEHNEKYLHTKRSKLGHIL